METKLVFFFRGCLANQLTTTTTITFICMTIIINSIAKGYVKNKNKKNKSFSQLNEKNTVPRRLSELQRSVPLFLVLNSIFTFLSL